MKMKKKMIQPGKVVLVCTGNVCRSPMAEYILRSRLGDGSGWQVVSAGVLAGQGAPASPESVRALEEIGLDLRPHQSQPLTEELVDAATLLVVMTRHHAEDVLRQFPAADGRVVLLTSFGSDPQVRDIPDPIGQSLEVYRWTRDQIESATSDLVLHIKDRWGLQPPSHAAKEQTMIIAIGSDHGGFELKTKIKALLADRDIEVEDAGADSASAVDYPDFAEGVARKESEGAVDEGILICTTGIGMSIAANKFPRVRAALCTTPRMARLARTHNNANLLSLGAETIDLDDVEPILDEWFSATFEKGGRHERRLEKIRRFSGTAASLEGVYESDPEIYAVLKKESTRQYENLELIASENYTSRAVREAQGSVLTNKYAEGYPGKRWYHGCEFVDEAEQFAIDRAKQLFGAEHANVQPHSGSGANMAVYFSMLEPGDTILAMRLDQGGHLTHGHKVNFSGRFFNVVQYGVDKETELMDYDRIDELAAEHKPRLICAGASAYSRIIDFERLRKIADSVGTLLMVDMAHIAGLVAAGCHPNPVPHSDFVTTTTHKTLRGPRGGLVLCRERYAKDLDRQVFPGTQGGPFMHTIAAKAICLHEAQQPDFKTYQEQVVKNAKALAAALEALGLRIVSGGTDNHLMMVDLTSVNVTGKDAAQALDRARITVNKNAIPFDSRSPFVTSGVRLGTPAVTTRGMKEPDMQEIAKHIHAVLDDPENQETIARVRDEVVALTKQFPVP